jgi:hypothetical protein
MGSLLSGQAAELAAAAAESDVEYDSAAEDAFASADASPRSWAHSPRNAHITSSLNPQQPRHSPRNHHALAERPMDPASTALESAALAEAASAHVQQVVDAVCEAAAVETELVGAGAVLALQRVLVNMGALLSRLYADPYRPLPSEDVGGDSASLASRQELATPPPTLFESDEAADLWAAAALSLTPPSRTMTAPHDDDAAASASSPPMPDEEVDAADLQDRLVDALVTDADAVRGVASPACLFTCRLGALRSFPGRVGVVT